MENDRHKKNQGAADEAEFEASLVPGVDADLIGAETEVVEHQAVPQPPDRVVKQPPWAGKVLGHFKLLRLIGEGKMGRVIQARDINLQRIVALKVISKRLKGPKVQGYVNQFLREARAAAQIEHPNVVHVYEINQHDGWWYIAMEMLDAGNIRQIVKAAGPLSVPRACALIADAATGLAAAHQLGIIHRDIKPANLMLTRRGRCKLTDFGLVRLDDPNDPFDFTRKAVGSPAFMAPEMILSRKQTPAIDIYSLGATLIYTLTGKTLYTGKNIQEILRKHVRATTPDIRKLLPDCPDSLAALITRSISKDPAGRPSAEDMASALRAEAIEIQADDSGVLSQSSSGYIHDLTGTHVGAPPIEARPEAIAGLWEKIRGVILTRGFFISAIVIILMIAVSSAIFGVPIPLKRLWFTGNVQPVHLAKYFPDAPESYGVLPPSTVLKPISVDSETPPLFSWTNKINPKTFRFAASKRGLHFYPVNAPEAILIREEDFVGYQTREDALADGRIPAH